MEEENNGYKKLINGNVINSLKSLEDQLEKREPTYSEELAALPIGHPVRKAIEEAKEKAEERERREQLTKEASGRIREKRMARKANKKKRVEKERVSSEDVDQGRRALVDLNKKIDNLKIASAEILKEIPKAKDNLEKFPDEIIRLSKLERLIGSIHKGVSNTNFNKSRIIGD